MQHLSRQIIKKRRSLVQHCASNFLKHRGNKMLDLKSIC